MQIAIPLIFVLFGLLVSAVCIGAIAMLKDSLNAHVKLENNTSTKQRIWLHLIFEFICVILCVVLVTLLVWLDASILATFSMLLWISSVLLGVGMALSITLNMRNCNTYPAYADKYLIIVSIFSAVVSLASGIYLLRELTI